MSALSEACAERPFSNGTEGSAWMDKWCGYCTHDHLMHSEGGGDGPGCELILNAMLDFPSKENPWPEAWLPEPDDGTFHCPSRMVCSQFAPCEPCGGDPFVGPRAEQIEETTAYWRDRDRAAPVIHMAGCDDDQAEWRDA